MVRIDKKILDDVTKIIGICDITTEFDGYAYIEDEYIDSILEDLVTEYNAKDEELEDVKNDLENNYVSRPMSDYTGDRDDDRY